MVERKHSIRYFEFSSLEELPVKDRELLFFAREALNTAYAPYSHYRVGAAVLLDNGEILTGSNQENMAFPSGLCAERVALFAAASSHPGIPVNAIAITARSEEFPVEEPVTPCGACRQAMIEYEMRNQNKIRIILQGETGKIIVIDGTENLLPLSFREDGLKK